MRVIRSKPIMLLLSLLIMTSFYSPHTTHAAEPILKNAVDIVFVIDESGSMSSGFDAVEDRTNEFVANLYDEQFNVQLGIVGYEVDVYSCSNFGWQGFTDDVATFENWISETNDTCGGTENGANATEYAIEKLVDEGRPNAGKMIVLLTDEANDDYSERHNVGNLLEEHDIVLNTILSGTDSDLFEYLDDYTDGTLYDESGSWDNILPNVYDDIMNQIGINEPPVIESVNVEPQIVDIGETIEASITATDPDGDNLNYTWEAVLPNGNSRLLGESSDISFPANVAGTWTIHAIVQDTWGEGVEQSINITVNAPDIEITEVSDPPPDSIHRGDTLSVRAYIDNIGGVQEISPFDVELRVDDTPVQSIELNEPGWVEFSYQFNHSQGDHKIEIVADANNDVMEESEDNNQREYWTNVPNREPEANFEWTPGEPIVNESNTRVYSTSTDPDGDELSYQWEYTAPNGDTGTFGTSKEFRELMEQIGDWEVTLHIEDEYGGTDSITKAITVYQKNELNAQILHTEEWADERGISRSDPDFLAGEGFVIEAETTETAVNVSVIPPANLADQTALKANDNNTEWNVSLTSNDLEHIVEGPYPWIVRATFDDGQVVQEPLLINITDKVDPDVHLTQ
ncbi:VWA domain-containing protein [Lentibacillus salinarum]|uniref:VWA domain-containing protein n=1 Tax=Lentibacillus salinarum TaxID=446820 RepID=A0ABW3ZZ93_9BACI